ncbi:hypothetical protein [Wolbachia pipientis]|uniref:hypothetical protein n=1 Tax=Wolbachia pipientis TaxID=955 RepID=UPI0025A3AF6A|nr:hypothetical protein [Wolbachia pipientis]MDM8334952.1 hypothetical protein [Wolbachia pipientis]
MPIFPIAEPTEINAINNSTSNELGQSALESQDQRKSPKKRDKENLGPRKSP